MDNRNTLKEGSKENKIFFALTYSKKIIALFLLILTSSFSISAQVNNSAFIKNKTKGLLIGSLIGDAFGGPIEYKNLNEVQATPNPPKIWKDDEIMDEVNIKLAQERIYFREYKYLFPQPIPYGIWSINAQAGTVTDDSRHKMILLYFLRNSLAKKKWNLTGKGLALEYLAWPNSPKVKKYPGYNILKKQWSEEINLSINWLLGNREKGKAYPMERLWNGLPTCNGQMALTPLAAIYPNEPEKAYLAAYHLAFFDTGMAKDLNAALVAGLSVALTLDASKLSDEELWNKIFETMKKTDPYNYSKIPWSDRSVTLWLRVCDDFVKNANGSPSKLFKQFDKAFLYNSKWEAQVPFVVIFSVLKLCKYNPMAALQLSIEWGWDTDSYPQLLGAFIGAIYGPSIFKDDMIATVTKRLELDYNENVDEWVSTLIKIKNRAKTKKIFRNE